MALSSRRPLGSLKGLVVLLFSPTGTEKGTALTLIGLSLLDQILSSRLVGNTLCLHEHKAGRGLRLAAMAVVAVYAETGFWFNDRHIPSLSFPSSGTPLLGSPEGSLHDRHKVPFGYAIGGKGHAQLYPIIG